MGMSPEVQAEYDDALREAILRHGTLVDTQASTYGWEADDWKHARRCTVTTRKQPYDDRWDEFAGTFEGSYEKHGVSLDGVHCACGELVDRTMRWDADVSTMMETIFTIAMEKWRGDDVAGS